MASGWAVGACKRISSLLQKANLCHPFNVKPVSSSLQIFSFRGLTTQGAQQTEDDLYSKIMIEVKGHDPKVLDSYYWYLKQTAYHLNLGPHDTYVQKKPVIDKLTLNKSVHIYKKHRVQYEARTHYRTFIYYYLTGSTASAFLEYIQRNLPEGIAMKVTKFKMERLPEHLQKETVFSLEEKGRTESLLLNGTENNMEIPSINIENHNLRKRDIHNNLFRSLLDSNFETCRLYDRQNKNLEPELEHTEPEHTEMITSEPEHTEVISSEPEHTEVISSEPEHTEVISSEPEHTEVISSEPEHTEVISSEPKKGVQNIPTKTAKLEGELPESQSDKDAAESDSSSSSDSESSDSDSDSEDENDEDKKTDEETGKKPGDQKDNDLDETTSEKDPRKK